MNKLKRDENNNLAVGGSRQHILNCHEYTPSKIYCFKYKENISNYQPSLLIRKNSRSKADINRIIRRLFEAGILDKWKRDCQREKNEIFPIIPLEMQLEHLYLGLIFVLGIGSCLSIITFIAELITSAKINQEHSHRFWSYLEQFLSAQRYYFNNLLDHQ